MKVRKTRTHTFVYVYVNIKGVCDILNDVNQPENMGNTETYPPLRGQDNCLESVLVFS